MKTAVLNIRQFEKSTYLNDVYVNSFSDHIKLNEDLLSKPHSHNFYLCVLFTQGTGIHEIDFNSYAIHPGKVFFLKPGQTHFWKFESKPNGFIFFHSQDFYELQFLNHRLDSFPFYYSYQNPPVLDLHQEKVAAKFGELYKEYQRDELFKEMKIINLINSIYIDLTREYTSNIDLSGSFHPSYLKILDKLEKLINRHFYEHKLPGFYANQLNITTKHLNRVVKETINKTTNQLISERVILEAKRLIVHTGDNLSKVAYTLEFSDYAYFSKVFKAKTGLTPLDFKKKYVK